MAFNFQPRGVSGTGQPDAGSGLGAGMYRPGRPAYSEQVSAYNRGFGSAANGGRGDTAQEKRPFKLVGKNTVNLLDPGSQEREQQRLYADYGIEPVKHEGFFGPVQDYFDPSTPGGLISGLLGALGQTVGGVFGDEAAQGGAEVGGFIGKLPESVMGVVGSVGLPDVFVPYIDQANGEIEKVTPYLARDTIRLPTNLGGVVMSMLNGMGLLGRMVERTYAGFDERGGMPESIAARVESGELTRDEGLDEMVMQGLGFSDDPWHNMALSMVTDPFNWFTLGVGAVGASARGGIKLAEMVNRSGRLLNAVEHGARLGALGDRVRAGQVVRYEDIQNLSRPELRRARMTFGRAAVAESKTNPVMKLGTLIKLKMVPSATEVLGPIPDVTSNLFYKTAQTVIRNTDPFTFLGGRLFGTGNVGKRSMEYMAVASTAAVYSAFDPMNVRALADLANGVTGGEDILMEALGVGGGNVLQEFALAEHVADGLRAGMVPVLSDSAGKSLSSTEAARSLLRGGAFDTNIGKHMEVQTIRNQPALFVRRAGETTEEMTHARVLAESRQKLASILGPTWNPMRLTANHLNEKMASLIHFAYYYRKGATFHNEVVPVLVAAGSAGTLPAGLTRDMSRLTLVAERTLTKGRAAAIRAAVVAKDAETVRDLVSQYKNFDWLKAHQMDAPDLLRTIEGWLDTNEAMLLDEVDFIDPATGARYAGLPKELEDWLADADTGFGYRLAEAPPDNIPRPDLYGAVRDENGMLMGMSPWLDFLANPARDLGGTFTPSRPSLMAAYQSRVFGRVRQERIRWESQRRFITDMSKGTDNGGMDVSPALSEKLWRGLMQEAERQRLQPRGLAPQDIAGLIHRTLEEAKSVQDGLSTQAEHLTERQVTNALLRATRGDLWTVGLTQRVTGAAKASLPGAGSNFWGRISENLFPLVRFGLNPIFQLQELLEPYILDRMRGVAAPLDRNSPKFKEALATHNAIMQLVRTSLEPDGMMAESAEYLKLYAADFLGTRQTFGANSWWGRVAGKFTPGIQERKAALASLQAKELFGERFRRSIDEMYGPEEGARRWREMEEDALSVDKGEVAMRWMATNMHLANQNGEQVAQVLDLLSPHTFGPRFRITHEKTPGALTFGEVERHIDGVRENDQGYTGTLFKNRKTATGATYKRGDALLAHLKSIDEADWMREAIGLRGIIVSAESARTIWRMANAKTPEQFWREYRPAYLQLVKSPTGIAAETVRMRNEELRYHRAFVQTLAHASGLTEAEYIARVLNPTDTVRVIPAGGAIPLGALTDMRKDWAKELIHRTKVYVATGDRLTEAINMVRNDPVMADAEDFLYLSVPDQVIPGAAYNHTLSTGYYWATRFDTGWRGLDDAQYSLIDGNALIRMRKTDRNFSHSGSETRLNGHDVYDLSDGPRDVSELGPYEVFRIDDMQWVPLSTLKARGVPDVPPLPDVLPEIERLYVPPGTSTVVPGVHKIEIDDLLTAPEKSTQLEYTVMFYKAVNDYKRGLPNNSGYTDAELDRAIALLESGIEKGALNEMTPLIRGVNLSDPRVTFDYEGLKVGDTFPDAAFGSFSREESTARQFAMGSTSSSSYPSGGAPHRALYIKMDAPAGMNMAVIEGHESELVTRPGMQYRVLRVERKREGAGSSSYGRKTHWTILTVEPINAGIPAGVKRMIHEDLPPGLETLQRFARDAVLDPEGLRARAAAQGAGLVAPTVPPVVFTPGVSVVMDIPGSSVPISHAMGPTDNGIGVFTEPAPVDVTTAGVVITEPDGRVWVFEPLNHFDGYEHTWPKGRPDPGEGLREAAIREIGEEMGFSVKLTGFVGDYDNASGTSRVRMYKGERTGGSPAFAQTAETASIKLVSPEDARGLLLRHGQPTARDQAILDAVAGPAAPAAGAKTTAPPQTPPTQVTGLQDVQYLGGTTGANKVQDPYDGRYYVEKRGASGDQVLEEVSANNVYAAVGAPVPAHVLIHDNGPVQRANFIEGETLRDWLDTASPTEQRAIFDQISENFALDSLLGNWDAMGEDGRNIVISGGIAYRVDQGGSLRFRAMGQRKAPERFTTKVGELKTLRDPGINAWGARVYGNLTEGDIRRQVLDLYANRERILDAIDEVTPELRAQIDDRLEDMMIQTAGVTPTAAVSPISGVVESEIAEAAKWLPDGPLGPSDPHISLSEDADALTPDEIEQVAKAYEDVYGRMQDLGGSNKQGMQLVNALSRTVVSKGGMRLGLKELVRRMEEAWDDIARGGDASVDAIERALHKGSNVPQTTEYLEQAASDALDAMLGNRTRRVVGRGEDQMPVLVDEFAMMDVGYAPGTEANKYTHEVVVDFYNRKAEVANAMRFQGRIDWTAAEMQLISQFRWQKKLGKSGVAVDPVEIDMLAKTLPVEVYPGPGSELAEYGPLLDIFMMKAHREQLDMLMSELGLTISNQMMDVMGVPVDGYSGVGVGIWDDNKPQAVVPLTIISSPGRAKDVADVMSYAMDQAEVWSFSRIEPEDIPDLKATTPRMSILIPAQDTDRWTRAYALALGKQLDGVRGLTAMPLGNREWELSIIDEDRTVFRYLEDGSVDEAEFHERLADAADRVTLKTNQPVDGINTDVEYGELYKAGPAKLDDGSYDWGNHLAETQSRLRSRSSRLTEADLDGVRSTYQWHFKQALRRAAPRQVRRIESGAPLVPGRLEDFRGGTVRGYTDFRADGRAVMAAVGEPDPLTGLHELVHVHARTLDPSAKQRVIDAYDDWRTKARDNLTTRIANADAKAAAAKSKTTQRRWQNESNSLRHSLGSIGNEVDWGAEHEEFIVLQFMEFIDSGRSLNPELTNVFQHFRTWTTRLRHELKPKHGPQVPFSPQMETFFNEMLRKPIPGGTFPYSVEQETLRMAAKQQLRDAWDEAHGTHYYRKDRSWLERSVNHPYIGVYPSSYMWGKVLPEMFRFLALRPFGYETPFLAWNVAREVSDTMRYQSETNDDFREYLSTNERAFMLANMMFPALPADIPANISLPVRRIAEQGLMNQLKFSRGVKYGDKRGEVHAVDYLSGLEDAVNYAIGPLGFARTAGEVGEMAVGVGQTLLGQGEEEEEAALPRSPFSAGRAEQ